MIQRNIHRPTGVVPDKDPVVIDTREAKRAENVRIGNYAPEKDDPPVSQTNSGVYKLLGNTEIPNQLLPRQGSNVCIGQIRDETKSRIVFANYNSLGTSAIYEYNALTSAFRKILDVPDFQYPSEVDMGIRGDILIWTDNIEEPRTVNIEKAANGEYGTIDNWKIAQLHRRPAEPLNPVSDVTAVSEGLPKPIDGLPERGYQFGYNYQYFDFIESRISDPTQVIWNKELDLQIPDSEWDTYIFDGTNFNNYIQRINFFFRIGNDGGWVLFKKVKPQDIPTKEISITDINSLTTVGGTTASALLEVDGIGRRVKNNYFADNRIIHGGIFEGYDVELPESVISVAADSTSLSDRNFRMFPPVKNDYNYAVVYYDKYDRVIGGKILPTQQLFSSITPYKVNLNDIRDDGRLPSWFDLSTWQGVVDYFSTENSQYDINQRKRIDVTVLPSQTIAPEIKKAVLATRGGKVLSFLRTIARPYWIYKDKDGNFLPYTWITGDPSGSDIILRSVSTVEGITYTFYGIGFEFLSGEPISFSREQNLNIQVFGQTVGTFLTQQIANSGKVTDQFGSILICKLEFETAILIPDAPNTRDQKVRNFSTSIFNGSGVPAPVESLFGKFNHTICDICLYSTTPESSAWNIIPEVSWTRNDLLSGATKSHYGLAYATKFKSTLGNVNRKAIISNDRIDETVINGYWTVLTPIDWTGYFGSMSLNGNFIEKWDKDIGITTAIEEEPTSVTQQNTLAHGGAALSNTKINNLFAFNLLDRETVSSQIGPITRVQSLAVDSLTGENLIVVCKLGVSSVFLNRTILQDTGPNANIVSSTSVFGTKNVYQQAFGASRLYDVVTTDKGLLFYYDNNKKALCQVSAKGIDVISEQKLFKTDCLRFASQPDSFIGYDPFFMEILTHQTQGKGIAYNFITDVYQGRRFFGGANAPSEMFAFLGVSAYSFYKGSLFSLNQNPETSFNGEVYNASIAFVSGGNIPSNKDARSVMYKCSQGKKWIFEIYSDNGIETSLDESDFYDRKDYFEAAVKRATNSTGGKYSGPFVDGAFFTIIAKDFDTEPKDLIFVEFDYSNALTDGN